MGTRRFQKCSLEITDERGGCSCLKRTPSARIYGIIGRTTWWSYRIAIEWSLFKFGSGSTVRIRLSLDFQASGVGMPTDEWLLIVHAKKKPLFCHHLLDIKSSKRYRWTRVIGIVILFNAKIRRSLVSFSLLSNRRRDKGELEPAAHFLFYEAQRLPLLSFNG